MALGERFRSGGARGIARFLSDHQHCDVGFDVRRDPGASTGLLSITCKGCGEAITYKAAEAGELAAGPELVNGGLVDMEAPAPAPEPPREPPEDGLRRVSSAPSRPRRRSLTRLISTVLIGALILAGLVLIAVGVLRSNDDSNGQAPAQTVPAQATPPAEGEPAPAPPPEQPTGVALKRRDFENRFAIGVPAGWSAGEGVTAIVIADPGGVAQIRVFLEPGEERVGQLVTGASQFLAAEHEGAEIGDPSPLRLGEQQKALTVTAAYDGGEEVAAVLAWGGYTFLVLKRVDSGAPPEVAAQADAALRSFRAKNR
jgi:hypothetical protein